MTINRSEQSLEQRLITEIANLKREMLAQKTNQRFGGDNFVYDWSGVATASFTIPSGDQVSIQAILTSLVADTPLFPIFLIAVYVNASSPDPTKLWPTGSALSTDEKRYTQVSPTYDLYNTTADAMTWTTTTQIFNGGGFDLPFYVQTRWRFPALLT